MIAPSFSRESLEVLEDGRYAIVTRRFTAPEPTRQARRRAARRGSIPVAVKVTSVVIYPPQWWWLTEALGGDAYKPAAAERLGARILRWTSFLRARVRAWAHRRRLRA